jgi:hypothetical protein
MRQGGEPASKFECKVVNHGRASLRCLPQAVHTMHPFIPLVTKRTVSGMVRAI